MCTLRYASPDVRRKTHDVSLTLSVTVLLLAGRPVGADDIPLFGVFEKPFEHSGQYENAYRDVTAIANVTPPNGEDMRSVPLFWDGESRWRFRFSPDRSGRWTWRVTSADPGLNGHSGEFNVVASNRRGSIRPMQGHPYHFERQDGSPFWFMGDTAWALYTDDADERHDRTAAMAYIDTRAEQGFNVVHSMLLSEAGWGNGGAPPFHAIDREEINPAYWQEVDRRMRHVNHRGMIAGLAVAWGDKRRVEPYAWRRFPSVDARKRYARYIASRYSAYDVYFIVSGEWHAEVRTRDGATESAIKQEFVEIGNALTDADPHGRMVTIHPMTRHGSVREFVDARWMRFGDYQQNYQELHGRLLRSRQFDLPIVNSEYGYFLRDRNGDGIVDKDNSGTLEAIRHASWDLIMAGGYFVTGFGTTYFGGHRDPGPFDIDAAKNDEWEEQIQHIKTLFTSLDWWQLSPADERITYERARGDDGMSRTRAAEGIVSIRVPPKVAYWLLADANRLAVAYVRGCDAKVTIRLESGAYNIRQFNPRTGRFDSSADTRIEEAYEYRPPDQHDWVLVLKKAQTQHN